MSYKFNPFSGNFDIVGSASGGTGDPGGSTTQVQFNDAGVFGGDSTFTFNKTTDTLTVANLATTGSTTLGDASGDTVALQAGTAALPTLIPNGDPNTGLWFPAADTIAASTAGTERLRIDSSGTLLLRQSSNSANTSVSFNTTVQNALTLDSSGNLHIGRSGLGSGTLGNTFGLCSTGAGYNESVNATSDTGLALWYMNRQSSTGTFFEFRYATATVGDISTNGTTTSYNTSSDYRLKENVQPITDALSRVALLKPSKYIWKSDQSEGEGFIAHELQEVVSQAVTGEKDGEQMQSVDYGKLTPLLAAAIQELHAKIESLEHRVN